MPAVMSIRVKIVALVISIGMMLLIIELVRRRKLREEYSWLWLLTGSVIIVLMMWFGLLKWTTHLIGAIKPSSAIFFLCFFIPFYHQPPFLRGDFEVDGSKQRAGPKIRPFGIGIERVEGALPPFQWRSLMSAVLKSTQDEDDADRKATSGRLS